MILISAALFIVACSLIWIFAALHYQAKSWEQQRQELTKRIERLEEAQLKRWPNGKAEKIEHATAALMKLKFEADYRREMVDNALAHLQAIRGDEK